MARGCSKGTPPRGVQKTTITLSSDGAKLSGDLQVEGRDTKTTVDEGTIKGNEFTFTSVLRRQKGEVKLFWAGKVDGAMMTGTIKTEVSEPRAFTAKKQ
ncbi:MAG: hypothetical protein O2968_18430 [Acidobacteria bacterium]|nr:hypothetical protein [Acidobacteriota bacterium]